MHLPIWWAVLCSVSNLCMCALVVCMFKCHFHHIYSLTFSKCTQNWEHNGDIGERVTTYITKDSAGISQLTE